jgi:hypothetical protein
MLRRCEMHCEFESILDSILMCTTCRADESSCSVSCPPQVSKQSHKLEEFRQPMSHL